MMNAEIKQPFTDSLSVGSEALARGAWEEARDNFKLALGREETPEALEGLGMTAWWLDDATTTFKVRERAYQLYRKRGDQLGAARVAAALAWDYHDFRDEPAIANGWLQRAKRLMEGFDPVVEHGWIALQEGEIALSFHNDPTTALQLSALVMSLGRSLGLIDLEMVGLSLEGLALASKGEVVEGMRCLDEAMIAAVAGELTDLVAIGVVCRNLIYACERVQDYERAAQWFDRVKEFCKQRCIRPLFEICRIQYATILIYRGVWAEAEAELTTITEALVATRCSKTVEAVVRLAQLRHRQGRLEEAASLFAQVGAHPLAQLGHAELALDQGDTATAADMVDHFLQRLPPQDRTARTLGLKLLVHVQIALGDHDRVSAALTEMQSIGPLIATEPLRASVSFAEGLVAAAAGDYESARCQFVDAVDRFERSGVPFETARARIELARSLYALDRCIAAEREIRATLESLHELGAAHLAEQAASLLRELENKTCGLAREASCMAGLTRRELEVLRLVAQGLSNHTIAARLVLSNHTVHRHVANILNKLDLPSRVAAAVFAAQHSLL
jgi:LuxR family transcriptional regulator, maltose regulon positive regulatory protein